MAKRSAPDRRGMRDDARFAVPMRSQSSVALAIALIAVLTCAVFAPVWNFGFLSWDDPTYVTQNPQVLRGLTWAGVTWAFTTGDASNWHPLTWLSHMLDVSVFGLTPGWHHAVNVVLHTLNAILLFVVVRRIDPKHQVWPAETVALLFAIHPLHVESVAWISERKDVLSTCFALLTMLSYCRYVRAPQRAHYALTLTLFALTLMAKPMYVTLPGVLLLIDYWPLARVQLWRSLVVEKLPFVALAAASSVATFIAQWHGGAVGGLSLLPWSTRVDNAAISYVRYLGKCFWPPALSAFYPYPPREPTTLAILAATAILALSWLAWRSMRRAPYLFVGWFWYLGTLMPVIGLIQVGDQAMADRYTYFPLIGVFLAVVFALNDVVSRVAMAQVARVAVTGAIV